MVFNLKRLLVLTLYFELCIGCSSVEMSPNHNTMVVIGTVIEVNTTEEMLRYALIDKAVLCIILINLDSIDGIDVDSIDGYDRNGYFPMCIVVPQSLEDSLGVEEGISEFFGSGQKWRFDARRYESDESPLEVGSFFGDIPMLLVAEQVTWIGEGVKTGLAPVRGGR